MKKHLLMSAAAVVVLAAGGVAVAQPVQPNPPIPQVFSWTGFYAGVNAGYSWGHSTITYNDPSFGEIGIPTSISESNSLNGAIGGFQTGYSWQLSNTWVAGFVTDWQWSAEKGKSHFNFPYSDCESESCNLSGTLSSKILWFGTTRAEFGWLFTPSMLVYATSGLAYGRINVSGSFSDDLCTPACAWGFSNSQTKVGWAAGAGIKGMLLNNLVWKVEYLHLDFGSISGRGFNSDFESTYNYTATITDDIVRFGLDWYFR
jgi:outer membrane immunogenic protein